MTFASMLEATGMSAVPVLLFIKATCLLLAAMAATFAMMRASSGARHLVWLVVLSSLLLLPVFAMWRPLRLEVLPRAMGSRAPTNSNLTTSNPASATLGAPNGAVGVRAGTPHPVPAPSPLADDRAANRASPSLAGSASASASASASGSSALDAHTPPRGFARLVSALSLGAPRTIGDSLLIVWAAVTLALLGWLAHGAWSVSRIVRRARPLEGAEWQTPLYEIADRFQLTDAPRILRSEDVRMPFACGVLHPTIVLPAESDQWTADRRSAVLLHELGHVQRRDLIGHTLGRLACAFYWFHPLVWTAARRLRSESERACDDLALSCGARPSDYAEHLLDIVTCVRDHATPSIALAMAHRKEFEGRMLAILNPELERKRPSRRQSVALAGTLALLCVVVSAAAPIADAKGVLPTPPDTKGALEARALRDGAKGGDATFRDDKVTNVVTNTRTETQLRVDTRLSSGNARGNGVGKGNGNDKVKVNANDNGAVALDLIRLNALKAFGVNGLVSSAVTAAASRGFSATLPAQTREDERPALLAKVLRSDTSSTLRRIAAWGLHEYANEDVAVDALVNAVEHDASATVREMAVWSLAEANRNDRVTTALMTFARRETDPKARATALWALGNLGDEKSLDVMTAAISSEDVRVRELAIWGIGNVSPRHAPPQLLSALSDKEPRVRLIAAWALFNLEDPLAVSALDAQLRRETDHDVQVGLVRALAAAGEKSVDAFKALIESKDQEIRETAIRALAGAGGVSPWPWPWPDPRPFP